MPEEQTIPFAGEQAKFINLTKFKGMNNNATRSAIEDEQFSWLENAMPIGDGNLRTVQSNGSNIFTAAGGLTIIYQFFFNIATSNYCAVFLSDGSAIQVNTVTLAQTTIGAATTFYAGGTLPQCAQWGRSGIVIVSQVAASGYWAWDGALWPPGNATSPTWLNGGTPTAMPSGLSGNAVEIYQSRVWIANNSVVSFSGPSNGASFSGATGGGSFTSSEPFLKSIYTCLRQAGGFLYLIGDSSVNVVSNVQTSGSPLTTTFNNQNIDPQIGTPWPNAIAAFGRGLVFANPRGIYALFGGAAEKKSDDIDGTFGAIQTALAALAPSAQPTAGLAMLFSIRVFCLVLPVPDPLTGVQRNVMACWDGKKWFMASQDTAISFIAGQEVNSLLTVYGCDTTHIFPCFTTTTLTLRKIIQTKQWEGDAWVIIKQGLRAYLRAQDNSGSGYSISATMDLVSDTGQNSVAFTLNSLVNAIVWIGAGGNVLQWTGAGAQPLNFGSVGLSVAGQDIAWTAALFGTTMQSTSPDFTMVAYALLYRDLSPVGG